MTIKPRPKVALVFGGGGARGAAHIGVLKVLKKEGIPIDIVCGTSMGAVVGGLYCAGLSPDRIDDLFAKGSLMRTYFTVPIDFRIAIIPVFDFPRVLGFHIKDGLYRGKRFANYLNKQVPETDRNIENLRPPFAAVALNLIDGKAHAIKQGNLGRALQASAAIPFLRRPVLINGEPYVDGGVTNNLPVDVARDMGADLVIAVDVDERFEPVPVSEFEKVGSVGHRVITLHLAQVDEKQIANADVVIHPKVNGIGLTSRKESDIRQAISAGKEAAMTMLPVIEQKIKNWTKP